MPIERPNDIGAALSDGMANGHLLLDERDLAPAFFDLRTGLAGEMFQKFVNYRVPLALVVADVTVHGERFTELAREHRSHPLVRVFPDRAQAEDWLATVGAAP